MEQGFELVSSGKYNTPLFDVNIINYHGVIRRCTEFYSVVENYLYPGLHLDNEVNNNEQLLYSF